MKYLIKSIWQLNDFLNSEIEQLGFIYEDSSVKKSVKIQTPVMLAYPNSFSKQRH